MSIIVPWGRADRILLVVDDLDRCAPDEIIDLIDGVKLMLEEQPVGKFVQALVLADNRVLEHAIRRRFHEFVYENPQDSDLRLKRVVREHMEKVFLCQFRLRPLNQRDVSELANAFAQEFESADRAVDKLTLTDEKPTKPLDVGMNKVDPGTDLPNRTVGPIPPLEPVLEKTLTFSIKEKQTIARTIEYHFGSGRGEEAPTPRFIRSFLFKYQLARMILQMGGRSYSPTDIAEQLARAIKSPNIKNDCTDDCEDELTSVARQVV